MLQLGRSSSGPGQGDPCLRPLKQPHCVSSCVYLWRMLNQTSPPFLLKQRVLGPFGHPQNLYMSVVVHLSPVFAIARGLVTQEESDNEGEDREEPFKIPTDLPWTVNPSSSVHSWGAIYQGPSEDEYYNRIKNFPYPVGYACIKIYKEKEYCQSIEEGPRGPVFAVREVGIGVVKSNSPQKVWNKISDKDKIRVHGMRHFGFESSEVLNILRAMVSLARGCPHEGNVMKVDAPIDVLSMNSSAEGVDSKDLLHQTDSAMEKEELEHVCINAENVDKEDDDAILGDEEGDSGSSDVEGNDDGLYVPSDGIVNAHNDEDDSNDALHDIEDDDSDFGGEEEEEVDSKVDNHLSSSHVHTDERMSSTDISVTHKNAGGPLTSFKRSFKSGPRKVTFTRLSRKTDDVVKQDYTKEGLHYQPPYSPRQKALPDAETQVWRKGEGLTGYMPKQEATEMPRIDEQGEALTDIVIDYGRQQAAERAQVDDEGEWVIQNVPGFDKQQATERVIIDDSRAFSSFNHTNVVNSWESSGSKRNEEIPKSSHMLLELLNKWNKATKWDHESGDKLQQKAGKKQSGKQDDSHSLNELDAEEERSQESSQIRFIKEEETVLYELCNSGNVDESTEFAVSKLFETEGKPHLLSEDGSYHPSHRKPSSNVPKNGVDGSRGLEILNLDQSFLDADSHRGLKNRGQGSVVSLNFSGERNNSISFTGRNKSKHESASAAKGFVEAGEKKTKRGPFNVPRSMSMAGEKETRQEPAVVANGAAEPPKDKVDVPKRGADGVRLIEEVRKLITRKRFEDAFQKVRAMKLSGIAVDDDVYEAVLGFKLDPWQKEALKQVSGGYSVLVSGPTGAGKSIVADCCLYSNVVNEQRALFVTPCEHLANQSLHKFETMLGQSNVGGIQTRMRTQNGPKLVVITLQMLSRILHELNGPGGSEFRFFFEGVNMVVLDKFVTFGEASQGRLWEEIFMLMDSKIQVIALTLPAANEREIVSWISTNRGPCKLVSCTSEPIQKRYLFGHKSGLFPLLDHKGLQVNSNLLKTLQVNSSLVTKDHLESPLGSGHDTLSFTNMLKTLEVKGMLPAFIVFLDVQSCDIAMQDAISDWIDGLLSRADREKVERLFNEFGERYPTLWNHIDKADRQGLHKGFAMFHEGKLPLWKDFVVELFQENLVKVIVLTESSLLRTELMARTVILPTIHKVTDIEVSPIGYGQFLQLIGRAGRRVQDTEGNVIFLDNIHSGPQEAASLLLDNTFIFSSCFKPSFSLVANLMAKHRIEVVKKILGRTFADFQFFTKHTKAKKLKELDQDIFNCLEAKSKLDAKLFEGLTQVNKHKLSNAAMFTRVDIRMTLHLVSYSGNTLPGILLATVPVKSESFYMVFGADNNFRLLPVGAFDYVYSNEVPPLDVLFKQSTGRVLQTPLVPPKEKWTADEDGLWGYVASGNSQTKEYVKLMMQYPVQPHFARDCLQLRRDIFGLEAQVSNLIEKRKALSSESNSLKSYEREATRWQEEDGETWKTASRLVDMLQKVDALSIIDSPGAYVKLKPLGMLIARLHNVENELWLATVVTSKYVNSLLPAEFAGLMATTVSRESEVEGLFTDQRELSYRVTKSLKTAFASLEVLRRQIAALQGSYIRPLQFDTAFAGLVYAWARGKPGTQGVYAISPDNGDIAWKLKSIARLINSVYRACCQVSVDISERNDFDHISSLARRAEQMLSKHLTAIDRTLYQ